MQNRSVLMVLFVPLLVFCAAAQDPASLLTEANQLKHAEKYEAAQNIYDQVLKLDPDDPEAKQGKADCELMLSPPIMIQHLAPIEIDEEYRELIKKYETATTPWDKRRADMAIELYAVRYTGKVFGRQAVKYEQEADRIIARFKDNPTALALSNATDQLKQLQAGAHQAWKGHGPEILAPALLKLRQNLRDSMLEL